MANVATFDPQYLNIPIRSLLVGDSVFPVVVREATIKRGSVLHDEVTLSVVVQGEMTAQGYLRIPLNESDPLAGTRDVPTESLVGKPVTFVYGVPPNVDQFYGYVLSMTPDQKFKQGLNFTITMAGATLALQRVNRRFYTNVTATEFARRCLSRSLLGYTGPESNYRWPSLGVTKSTDWKIIQSMSRLIGTLLFNWNGVVMLYDPIALFKKFPYTTLVSSDDLLESDRKLLDFKPTEHTADQVAKQPKEFFFFDDNGKVVSYRQPSTNPTFLPHTDSPVRNRQEAELLGRSSTTDPDRWLQSATARIRGDAAIYPSVTVDVNTGTRSSTAKFNGRWLVLTVKHSMGRDAFNTELTLVRPGDTIPALTGSSFEHFWRTDDRPKPAMYLRNGQWVSTWADTSLEVAV